MALTAAATLTMAAPLLLTAPTQAPSSLEQQAHAYTSSWAWVIHWAAILSYLGWALVGGTTLCFGYARRAAPGPLRTGLLLIGTGIAAGLGVIALKALLAH